MAHKIIMANPAHEVAYVDLCALVSKHSAQLTAAEMLALAANMLGKLVAMQDQRVMTKDIAMEIIARNLEQGNHQMVAQISQTVGSA